jgi:outer membrane receptor protein involved in Fe transport
MWVVPDKLVLRYNHAKTVARPPVDQLLPAGTCIYDEPSWTRRRPPALHGTVGNPALMAQRNVNQNLSVEYYPNKDTMFTVSAFNQKGIVGPSIKPGREPGAVVRGLAGSRSGHRRALADLRFDYTTWMNGAATTRKGLEFSTKTAFTFLPWFLRYTGFDANYSKLRSATSSRTWSTCCPATRCRRRASRNTRTTGRCGTTTAGCRRGWRCRPWRFLLQLHRRECAPPRVNNYPNVPAGRTTVIPYNPGFAELQRRHPLHRRQDRVQAHAERRGVRRRPQPGQRDHLEQPGQVRHLLRRHPQPAGLWLLGPPHHGRREHPPGRLST